MNQQHDLTLYSYWRSSASYRVRIALALKQLDCNIQPIHLVRDGGQQHAAAFRRLNPQGLVPCLVHGGLVLSQSMAIIEYLDEVVPDQPLLPESAAERAQARRVAQAIACDIHPLNNLRVLQYLDHSARLEPDARTAWYRHWTEQGLMAVEAMLSDLSPGSRYALADSPGLADCFVLPQVYNARRFGCSLAGCERIAAICEHLQDDPAIKAAAPENQPDAE